MEKSAADRYTLFSDLSAEAEPPRRGVHSQTLYEDERVELLLFGMAPGERLSKHTSAKAAVVHVLTGTAQLTVAGDDYGVGPGAWLHLPPRTEHAIAAGDAGLTFALYLFADGRAVAETARRDPG